MWLYIFVSVCVYILYMAYLSLVKPKKYWENKGIDHIHPWTRYYDFFLSGKSFFQAVQDAYDRFPGQRYYGSYQFLRPSLFLKDVDLIRSVMVKDFEYFPDHFSITAQRNDPVMACNLFTLKGDKWKDIRTTLSPAFNSIKMKSMFPLMAETAENFTDFFDKNEDAEIFEFEMKDLYSKYTNDIIANCAFGIKCNSLLENDREFFEMGKEITSLRGSAVLLGLINMFFPRFIEALKISVFSRHVVHFFKKLVKDTILNREKNGIIRPDMIHLLIEARKGRLKHEEKDEETAGFATVEEYNISKNYKSNLELTDDVITAQVLIFFMAGFDTSSSLLSLMSYELALNPDIQKKLQQEIDEFMKNSSGKIQYEDILKMKYLDQVVSETLRKYPPGYIVNRQCVKDYKIPAKFPGEKDLTLEKGRLIAIPINGIHSDPQYFPDPHKFDPERFNEENKGKIVPGSYLPFGAGPRNCIASRFALLESKALAVHLLFKFDVVPVERTAIPLRFTKTFILNVKNGLYLGLKKRRLT